MLEQAGVDHAYTGYLGQVTGTGKKNADGNPRTGHAPRAAQLKTKGYL